MLLVSGLIGILRMELFPLQFLGFIRLMRVDRNIYLKVKKSGGMKITFQSPPKIIDEKMISNILRDYKLLNCEVLVRDEYGTPCLYREQKRVGFIY